MVVRRFVFAFVLAMVVGGGVGSADSNISEVEQYAWAESAGWSSWKATQGGVVIHGSHLSGFAWAENVGWIKLGVDAGGPYQNTNNEDWGVNRGPTGDLSGYGWSENSGWISFAPSHGGVTIDENGLLSGYAWSENLGWIHLSNPDPAYGVGLNLPQLPTAVTSDRDPETWSNDAIIEVEWSGATGNGAGHGYSFLFDQLETTEPDSLIELEHSGDPTQTTSETLPDGANHYLHLRSCDLVGNCGSSLHLGPFWIDTQAPVVLALSSVAAPENGVFQDHDVTETSVTQVLARFNEPMNDPGGDSDPHDVTNPDNYLFVMAGSDAVLQTTDCAAGLHPDDVPVVIDGVLYDSGTQTAATLVNGGLPLEKGLYRLLLCGTTSLVDRASNALDGAGTGQPGSDHGVDVEVIASNLLQNPNFDVDLHQWQLTIPSVGEIVHGAVDADEATTSGSALVATQAASSEAFKLSQCVDGPPAGLYEVGGLVTVTTGLPDAPIVNLTVELFDQTECQGASLGIEHLASLTGDTSGTWSKDLRGSLSFPSTGQSAFVELTVDSGSATSYQVFFDNLFFQEDVVIFTNGFESGSGAEWSVVVE